MGDGRRLPFPLPCLLLCVSLIAGVRTEEAPMDTSRLSKFVDHLPDMPKLHGYELVDGVPKPRSLVIGMYSILWKFHRDLPPTRVFAYGRSKSKATVPGPTIESLHRVDTFVTWRNHLPSKHILPWDPTIPTAIPPRMKGIPTVVHLHGGILEPQSDGHADSWFTARFQSRGPTWTKKKYHYPNNQQPGNLWYHDHAMGLTRVNLLAGLVGAYVIRHPEVESSLGLPSAPEFDRTLVVFDRSFRADGSIYMNSTGNNPSIHPQWQPEYFGDAIIVNGKAWPYLVVQRRKYRFRIINASNARFFKFFFTNGLGFVHVGSDSAYLRSPVYVNETLLAPSEIADIVVDFSGSKSDEAILANGAAYPYPSGDPVNEANSKVMKFIIREERVVDSSRVPGKLIEYPLADVSQATRTRYITMYEYTSPTDEPTHLYINGRAYEERVTETPREGTTEVWEVINLTEDNHPLHIHLGLLAVVKQTEIVGLEEFKACMERRNNARVCHVERHASGRRSEAEEHERGWKNVYKVMPGHVTTMLVRFSYIHSANSSYSFDPTAEPGYVYHCHILDHEDNVMMRPLKIIR
ncbi:hypothetical protein MLD38_007549 [Melastoma candidum]|uniref:Uncharacterized protein n=1 Tax=Melastoma candidum TaxID=119954 RepID=A0ACB9RQZ2_9MYRT|nr:hypothetical protein MLD38_007549 [Melastoma candidum]